ncbi:hypothetical protein BC629DRAFT_1162202 [Irpex lacteus]|nr:hypothetical protein BC629DRAFT_1162202 [Irpex lacteus]
MSRLIGWQGFTASLSLQLVFSQSPWTGHSDVAARCRRPTPTTYTHPGSITLLPTSCSLFLVGCPALSWTEHTGATCPLSIGSSMTAPWICSRSCPFPTADVLLSLMPPAAFSLGNVVYVKPLDFVELNLQDALLDGGPLFHWGGHCFLLGYRAPLSSVLAHRLHISATCDWPLTFDSDSWHTPCRYLCPTGYSQLPRQCGFVLKTSLFGIGVA